MAPWSDMGAIMEKWNGTWASVENTIMDAGISPASTEAIRKATAEFRHEGRKWAAYQAARRWLSYAYDFRRDYATLGAYAKALCFAEGHGLYGGSPRKPGTGTTRHPAFRFLGKGRRHATDGEAWTAAIAAVAAESQADVTVDPDGRLAIAVFVDGAVAYVPVGILLATEPEARKTFALHAARRGWHCMSKKLIAAAAKELEAAEKEIEVTEPPTIIRERIEVKEAKEK